MAVLFFLYPRLPPVRIVGSDLAHAVPPHPFWLASATGLSARIGPLSVPNCSVPYQASTGSHLAAHIADRFPLPALASMLMLMGLRLIALEASRGRPIVLSR